MDLDWFSSAILAFLAFPILGSLLLEYLRIEFWRWAIIDKADGWLRKIIFHRWIVDGWREFRGLGLSKRSVRIRALLCFFTSTLLIYSITKYVFNLDIFSNQPTLGEAGEAIILFVVTSLGTYLAFYQLFLNEFVSKYKDLWELYTKYNLDCFRISTNPVGTNGQSFQFDEIRYKRYKFLDTCLNFRLEENPTFNFETSNLISELLEIRDQIGKADWEKVIAPFRYIDSFLKSKSDSELDAYRAEAKTLIMFININISPNDGHSPPEPENFSPPKRPSDGDDPIYIDQDEAS